MTTVYDVPPNKLIAKLEQKLKAEAVVKPPDWASFVKTGTHREKAPEDADWWYNRAAAILRKIYMYGPIGTSRLAAEFGGKKDRGVAPYIAVKGSRNIVRTCLKQLQASGFVESKNHKGRVVTPKGQKLLDNIAHEVALELAKVNPEFKKYL